MAKAKTKIENPRVFDVIRRPAITEKSTIANELGKYTFEAARDATKTEIKQAVEQLFGVEVAKVNVANFDGKVKRFRGNLGRRVAYKKAIVTLKEGQSIDIAGGAA